MSETDKGGDKAPRCARCGTTEGVQYDRPLGEWLCHAHWLTAPLPGKPVRGDD